MNCETCKKIVKCEKCGEKLCNCACITCHKCAGQVADKQVKECDCDSE